MKIINGFSSYDQALEWRDDLSEDDVKYLKKVDQFISSCEKCKVIQLNTDGKKYTVEHFFTCIRYIAAAINLDFEANKDEKYIIVYGNCR